MGLPHQMGNPHVLHITHNYILHTLEQVSPVTRLYSCGWCWAVAIITCCSKPGTAKEAGVCMVQNPGASSLGRAYKEWDQTWDCSMCLWFVVPVLKTGRCSYSVNAQVVKQEQDWVLFAYQTHISAGCTGSALPCNCPHDIPSALYLWCSVRMLMPSTCSQLW